MTLDDLGDYEVVSTPASTTSKKPMTLDDLGDYEVVQTNKTPVEAITTKIGSKIQGVADTVGDVVTDTGEKLFDAGVGATKWQPLGNLPAQAGGALYELGRRGGESLASTFPSMFDSEYPLGMSQKTYREKAKELGMKDGNLNPDNALLDEYYEGGDAFEKLADESYARNPWSYRGGAAFSTLFGGNALAQGSLGLASKIPGLTNVAKSVPILEAYKKGGLLTELGKRAAIEAPMGMAMGAIQSDEKALGPESNIPGLTMDAVGGAATGTALGAGLSLAGDVAGPYIGKGFNALKKYGSELIEDTPLLKSVVKAWQEDAPIIGTKAGVGGQTEYLSGIDDNIKTLINADRQIGNEIGANLKQATDDGVTVFIKNEKSKEALASITDSINQYRRNGGQYNSPEINEVMNVVGSMLKGSPATPNSLQRVRFLLAGVGENPGIIAKQNDQAVADAYKQILGIINGELSSQVPGYAKLNNLFNKFRENMLEAVENRGKDSNLYGLSHRDYVRPADKMQSVLSQSVEGAHKGGTITAKYGAEMKAIEDQWMKMAQQYPEELKRLGVDVGALMSKNKALGENINVFRSAAVQDVRGGGLRSMIGMGDSVKGVATGGANVSGRVARGTAESISKLSKKLHNMTDDALSEIVNEATGNPNTSKFVKEKMAELSNMILQKDRFKKNALLYSMLSVPETRDYFFSSVDLQDNPNPQ